MSIDKVQARADRANKMLAALEAETDRGRACVGDALIDELLKQLFRERFIVDKEVSPSFINHGARLKLAYALGWIGPRTYADCKNIHDVRNAMAHNLDVDSFDHEMVSQTVDRFKSLGELQSERLAFRRDKFLCAVTFSIMRIWGLLDEAEHSPMGLDRPIERLDPEELAARG